MDCEIDFTVIQLLSIIASGQTKGNNFDKPGTSIRKNGTNSFSGRYEGKSISGKLDINGTGYVYYEGKRTYYDHGHATKRPMKPKV